MKPPVLGNFISSGIDEVRGLVLLSFFLQILLIIFGSKRKYIARTWITVLIWSTYMTADPVATFALGNIARSPGDSTGNNSSKSMELEAFWAPFLLLHLGGPDTITSYSREDNELWSRRLLEFLFQVVTAIYVFMRSLRKHPLSLLAIPMLITGILKYGERTLVLKLSSAKKLKDSLYPAPDPGPDILGRDTVLDMDSVTQMGTSTDLVPVRIEKSECSNPKDDYLASHFLFKRFRYLFADLVLGYHEQKESYDIIRMRSAAEAFKLVATELGFMYDVLYTKATIVYSKFGILLRCIYLFSHIFVSIFFLIIIHKHAYPTIDICITCVLLFGAVVLEIFSFIALVLFSDWSKLWWPNVTEAYNQNNFTRLDIKIHELRLPKQLQVLEFDEDGMNNIEEKWEMISEFCVEMLAYVGSHCEWKEHVQQLRKGGELITHVSFL
ncbi:uncharacterized protein LOC116143020 [Pistacia vera]|uniref:uncharacterized protein LOC116143020 n=1 Tax=Pistacia vera TaxID=55513 RepID=UPI001263245C|nr:uncharacterized protein LOC116143020 [Pistacia vera]